MRPVHEALHHKLSAVKRSDAIAYWLNNNTHADLASLYSSSMEVQVSVAQDGGERVQSEYQGRAFYAYTDGFTTWKSFRIPLKANSTPEDNDIVQAFDLATHVEGIGMTGWNWRDRCSVFVGFDFDAITGHSATHRGTLSDAELEQVKERACAIPWVTARYSTSGKGLHLYVFLDNVPTANHTEHAALARAILGQMSAVAGYDFHTRVDTCGGVLWQWHRKMLGTDRGLKLIKWGETLREIPPDWKTHHPVITGQERIVNDRDRLFCEMTGRQSQVQLDADHQQLLDFLRENGFAWSWQQDHHCLRTHTSALKKAHTTLKMKGAFDTVSTGKDKNDINCYCFPLKDGAWVVRRYGTPHETTGWEKDRLGYLKATLNQAASLGEAAKFSEAIEHKNGAFVFPAAESAGIAAELMGLDIKLPEWAVLREAKIQKRKDGRILVEFAAQKGDPPISDGWLLDKGYYHKIFAPNAVGEEPEAEKVSYDHVMRHLVTERREDAGWVVFADNRWQKEPKDSVREVLISMGAKKADLGTVLGEAILKPWTLTRQPFGPEYPGDRVWNRNAPRFKYPPSQHVDELTFPNWMKILNHIGKGLDGGVQASVWCRGNGILTGADYLKCWIASLFQFPTRPLPYLFLYSREQNTGKSILGEALERVIVDGVVRAKTALSNQSGFNGELEGKVLCTVEEGDLKHVKGAYEKIKEWVNSPMLQIHPKGQTPYQVVNTTHWIQTSNDPQGLPIDEQDSRITMIRVTPLPRNEIIPKGEFFARLDAEAPDFLAAMLRLEIPATKDRLNVPVVESEHKMTAKQRNRSRLDVFIAQSCFEIPGATIRVNEFYEKFLSSLDEAARPEWTRRRISEEMPEEYPKGRAKDSQWAFANLSFSSRTAPAERLTLQGDRLVPVSSVSVVEHE
jgi:hypothetical protein